MSASHGKSRRIHAGSNTVVSIIGAAVILVALNYLGMRHYARSDWTRSGIYTLSDKSTKMLRNLDKEVQIFVLWSQGDNRFPDVKELLDRYVGSSSKVKLEIIDPDRNMERFKWVHNRYKIKEYDVGNGAAAYEASVIVVSGENVKFVSSADFEDLSSDMFGEESGHEEGVSGYHAEQAISSAVLSVTSDSQQKVCFTQGHDEWPFEGAGGQSLGPIREELARDGYKVEAIATSSASRVPPGCDLVVVAGPQRGFMEEESAVLAGFLERSGRLLLLIDPIIKGDRFEAVGLEGLTAKYGIKMAKDVVLETDPARLLDPNPMTFTATEFTSHAAVKQLVLPDSVGPDLKAQIGVFPVVFSMARTLSISHVEGAVTEAIAKTSESSWGEVDLTAMGAGETVPEPDQYDNSGPTVVAAAVTLAGAGEDEDGGRLVVVGDSDILNNDAFVHTGLHNRDFWSGLIGWLTKRADLISIAPKNPEHVHLTMTHTDHFFVQLLVGFEVFLFIVLGVIVWIRRRR